MRKKQHVGEGTARIRKVNCIPEQKPKLDKIASSNPTGGVDILTLLRPSEENYCTIWRDNFSDGVSYHQQFLTENMTFARIDNILFEKMVRNKLCLL